ncbi:MAG: sulfotransferase [Candidatus Neomarinimicrobiota bacterium]
MVVGVPRSGTTWTARVLSEAHQTSLLHEPDNEKINVLAFRWKHGYHRMPYIREAEMEPVYAGFWRHILDYDFLPSATVLNKSLLRGFNLNSTRLENYVRDKCRQANNSQPHAFQTSPYDQITRVLSKASFFYYKSRSRRRIVKSVHTGLALPFLYQHFRPQVLLVFRHPANVVSSCLQLGLYDANREIFRQTALAEDFLEPYMEKIERLKDPVALMSLQVSIFYYIWEQQLKENPKWLSVTHESLCNEPEGSFRTLYEELGLEWRREVGEFLLTHDTDGIGYEIRRKAAGQIDKWRQKLTPDQVESVQKGYGILPVRHYHEFSTNR